MKILAQQVGKIILHPTSGGDKVVNPVFRGMKKGCPSLGNARRKKQAEDRRRAEELQAAVKPARPAPSEKQMEIYDVCHDLMRMAYSGECTGLIFAIQGTESHTFGTVGTYRSDKAAAQCVTEEMFRTYRGAGKATPVLTLIGGGK